MLIERLNNIIHHSFELPAKGLALFRIAFVLFTLLIIGFPHFSWVADNPDFIYNPVPSFAIFFENFPPKLLLQILETLIAVLYICLLFGYKTPTTSLLITGLTIIGRTFLFTLGKIDHTILFDLLPAMMAFSGWGAVLSIDSKLNKEGKGVHASNWTIALVAFTLAFAMFTAGLPKLFTGWLEIGTQATQGHLVDSYYLMERQELLAPFLLNVKSVFFWEILDYAAVLFEISFLFVIFRSAYFRIFVWIALFFHLGNLLMLNISFINQFSIYMLFLHPKQYQKWASNPRLSSLISKLINSKTMITGILMITGYQIFALNYTVAARHYSLSLFGLIFQEYGLIIDLIIMLTVIFVFSYGLLKYGFTEKQIK